MKIELEPGESVLVKCQALVSKGIRPSDNGEGDLWVTNQRLIWRRHRLSFPWWGRRVFEARIRDLSGTEIQTVATFGTVRIALASGSLVLIPYRCLPFSVLILGARLARRLQQALNEIAVNAPMNDAQQ